MAMQPIALFPVRQRFAEDRIEQIEDTVARQMAETGVSFAPGSRVAIAVGSRGVASLARVVAQVVRMVKAQGACPFIIPAMGSHGGATPEGQRAVLGGYGVTEEALGCPVVSSLRVRPLPDAGDPFRCYIAQDAWEADGVIVINRVKPHTDFHGPVESGLMKMLVIGLGKHAQALEMHRFGVAGLRDYIPRAARRVLSLGIVKMGIGIVENALDEICYLRACRGADIPETDAALLALARERMPSLPVHTLDLLLVDEMGKDISGTGLDTNIVGRMRIPGQPEPESPRIRVLIADGLTAASHGNALGMGLCDIITRRLYDAIDLPATTENVVTSGFLERGRIPVVAENSRQAVEWALRTLQLSSADELRMARIRSTLHLSSLWLSRAALRDAQASPLWRERRMEVAGPPERFAHSFSQ